jgi:hypothetical protein
VVREKRAEVLVVSNTSRPPQKPPPIHKPGASSKTPPGRKPGPARQKGASTKKNPPSILTDPIGDPTRLFATSMLKTVSKTQIASKEGPATSGKDPPMIGPDPLEDFDTGSITITDSNRTKGTTSTNTTTTTGLLAKKPGPARKSRPATQGRVGKNPDFFKEPSPVGFWVFFYIFAQKRDFLGFFSVSRILVGKSRL